MTSTPLDWVTVKVVRVASKFDPSLEELALVNVSIVEEPDVTVMFHDVMSETESPVPVAPFVVIVPETV